ncbi:glycerol kinase, partial [Trifolium pratense]
PISDIPISGCLGDQHAAMLGQACRKGEAKSTYETAYKLGPNAPTNYALEGSVAIAGAAVQWLRDGLSLISNAAEIEALALEVESNGGVYFVPAFNGLFAPWWRDDARGVCIGITRYTSKGHIARAVLESICFQVKDVIEAMHKDSGADQSKKDEFLLRVDGGATVNKLLMQTQADLLATPVVRPAYIETTALGAAYAAGLAVGIWKEDHVFDSKDKLKNAMVFHPLMAEDSRKKKSDSWVKASIAEAFPRLFSLSVQREAVISDLAILNGDGIIWNFSWRRRLFIWEEELVSGLQKLLQGVRLSRETDKWWWNPEPEGLFSVKSTYALLLKELNEEVDGSGKTTWCVVVFSGQKTPSAVLFVRARWKRRLIFSCTVILCCLWAEIFRWLGGVVIIPPNLFILFEYLSGLARSKKVRNGFRLV